MTCVDLAIAIAGAWLIGLLAILLFFAGSHDDDEDQL